MQYVPTTALKKLLALKKRIRAVSGGTGAAKTASILQILIDYAQTHPGELIEVVSESYPHLDGGAISEFKRIMQSQNYWDDNNWNGGSPRKYRFDKSEMQFGSYDTASKAHGPRRDVLYVNEANNLPWATVQQLIARTRKIVWLDWNPSEDFWFYDEILGQREDVDFMGDGGNYPPLTFLDNEGYDEGQKGELLANQHKTEYWRVYGLGLRGQLTNRIFKDWQFIDEIPHEARLERYGLDFGYTNDPSAIVALYYYNGGYILDEILFQKGLSNKQIADVLLNQKKALVIADSAEPKSIDEIASYGVSIMPTTKGPGSVLQRIQMAQDQRISVTKRSTHIIKEYRNYLWMRDKDGRIINEPDHLWSHSMDAFMYALQSVAPIITQRNILDSLPRMPRMERKMPAR